jgi:hypothetical protein
MPAVAQVAALVAQAKVEGMDVAAPAEVGGKGESQTKGSLLRSAAKKLSSAALLSRKARSREPSEEASSRFWITHGGKQLEPLFAHTGVVDIRWLLRFAKGEASFVASTGYPSLLSVPAWQDVPAEAWVSLDALRTAPAPRCAGGGQAYNALPLLVISYGWESRTHPDPNGVHLRRLQPVLQSIVNWIDEDGASDRTWGVVWGAHAACRPVPLHPPHAHPVPLHPPPLTSPPTTLLHPPDFLALPQRGRTSAYDAAVDDRTPEQLARFKAGLAHINEWCGMPTTRASHTLHPRCNGTRCALAAAANAAPSMRRQTLRPRCGGKRCALAVTSGTATRIRR